MSSYISSEETHLFNQWELGITGGSWFKKAKDGHLYQAYVHEGDSYVSFVPVYGKRVSRKLTMDKFLELFNND